MAKATTTTKQKPEKKAVTTTKRDRILNSIGRMGVQLERMAGRTSRSVRAVLVDLEQSVDQAEERLLACEDRDFAKMRERKSKAAVSVGAICSVREGARKEYVDLLDATDFEGLTVERISGKLASCKVPSGSTLFFPLKHLQVEA